MKYAYNNYLKINPNCGPAQELYSINDVNVKCDTDYTPHILLPHLFPLLWGRCVLWDASISPGLARPPLTILSPTSRSWCYSTTSALVFLSLFYPAPPSPSLSCLRIRLLFSIHAHTTSTYFPVHFLWYFSHLRCPSNSFIPDSVRHIQLLLLCFLHCPSLGTVHHCLLVLHTFLLTLKLILRSHRIPDTLFQFFHPDCILCVISASPPYTTLYYKKVKHFYRTVYIYWNLHYNLPVTVRKLQVAILAGSSREMSLTDRIVWKHILSRVRVSVQPRIFLYAKKHQTYR